MRAAPGLIWRVPCSMHAECRRTHQHMLMVSASPRLPACTCALCRPFIYNHGHAIDTHAGTRVQMNEIDMPHYDSACTQASHPLPWPHSDGPAQARQLWGALPLPNTQHGAGMHMLATSEMLTII